MTTIPQRDPISDPFTGVVCEVDGKHLLSIQPLAGAAVLHTGAMIVRYGVRLLGKPHLSIVPGILALDYGEMLTGDAMWEFILKKSNLYPRADVVGYRNDGSDDMIQIKWLDLALPVEPLVYADGSAIRPIAHPVALIAPPDAQLLSDAQFPPRILQYLPRFDSLSAWQA